jgi:beta-glucosidase
MLPQFRFSLTSHYRVRLGSAVAILIAAALAPQASCAPLQAETGGTGVSGSSSSACVTVTRFTETDDDQVIDLDAGAADAMAKVACGSDSGTQLSHTRGLGLDITQAKGYTPDTTIPTQAAALLPPLNTPLGISSRANQMRGTPAQTGTTTNFADIYRTLDDPTTMIKGVLFRDGPRGVNLESQVFTGPFGSPPLNIFPGFATVFPVSMAHGATWDLDLEARIGEDLADEVLASGNTLTISPCVNLLRHPAWGRSQEAYGEDSFSVGRMGTAYVDGAQNYIPTCVKHLAAYNVEDGRFNQNAIMDSQTLHEVFGRHFEMIVQEGGVACVMASYNSIQVNDLDNVSHKDTQNEILLKDMLRGVFGFKGFVMSDFWAMPGFQNVALMDSQRGQNAQEALTAGLDMEMPWGLNFSNLEAVGTPQQLDIAATRIVEQKLRFNVAATGVPTQQQGLKAPVSVIGTAGISCNEQHIDDAELQAEEAIVLLKNDNNTLPIKRSAVHNIAVIGADVPYTTIVAPPDTIHFATDARVGDLGSSRVALDPNKAVGPYAGILAAANVTGATSDAGADAGSAIKVTSGTDASLADNADFVVVVVGLTPQDEGEEYTGAGDRTDADGNPLLGLDPKSGSGVQDALVAAVAAKNKPMVVVIEAGGPVLMPWLDSVPAVVMAWYPGQAGGTALAKLLFGDVNFSGKLPITWPKSADQEPAFNSGGTTGTGAGTIMDYYLGYRYFDFKQEVPLFALGSGLSYTTFKYEFMNVPCSTVPKDGIVDVQVALTNTGPVAGSEVSFLFVSYPNTTARRSLKELKGFHRTGLVQPGQTVMFKIPLRISDLKYWNSAAATPGWTVESGPVQVMVGSSSDNLPSYLTDTLTVQ